MASDGSGDMTRCYRCGARLDPETSRKFKATCDNCHSWVHCCRNCTLYDERAHNRCRSPSTEWVGDPEKANYCAEFEFARRETGETDDNSDIEQTQRVWNELFRPD